MRRKKIVAVAVLAFVFLGVLFIVAGPGGVWLGRAKEKTTSEPTATNGPVSEDSSLIRNQKQPFASGAEGDSQVLRRLSSIVSELRKGAAPSKVLQLLDELRRLIRTLPPERAAAALIAFLETGEDQPTGLDFEIGGEGVMKETPTVRTAVLDLLGQTDPSQSVAYCRTLLRSTASADEYALALRNLGWSCPALVGRDELARDFRDMLARNEWISQPSRGFLEAFDVAVVAGAVDAVAPLLSDRPLGEPEPPLSRAAFVALDRMMLSQPELVVGNFKGDPSFLAQAPFHRASIMARLDPRVSGQKELLESYLLRTNHAAGEIEYFSEVFPNPNRFSSNRLVTGAEKGGSMVSQDAVDRAVLEVFEQWSSDPRFVSAKATIASVMDRLQSGDARHP